MRKLNTIDWFYEKNETYMKIVIKPNKLFSISCKIKIIRLTKLLSAGIYK